MNFLIHFLLHFFLQHCYSLWVSLEGREFQISKTSLMGFLPLNTSSDSFPYFFFNRRRFSCLNSSLGRRKNKHSWEGCRALSYSGCILHTPKEYTIYWKIPVAFSDSRKIWSEPYVIFCLGNEQSSTSTAYYFLATEGVSTTVHCLRGDFLALLRPHLHVAFKKLPALWLLLYCKSS